MKLQVFFSDFFGIDAKNLADYGAFNISLINDLPLFIDPFLLFGSEKEEYRRLHEGILNYVRFLRDESADQFLDPGLVNQWFVFPEVKQNWLGYSLTGNRGHGLGFKFARSLSKNLSSIFHNFGTEQITQSSHLEKVCLIDPGVGRDNISDFTTNLIKEFLLEYTQTFALENLSETQRSNFNVQKVYFNYSLKHWMPKEYTLPSVGGDYVILTPKDLLTKDENWINSNDLYGNFRNIIGGIPNQQLRASVERYFLDHLPKPKPAPYNPKRRRPPKDIGPTKKEISDTVSKVIKQFPELIDYYIQQKENSSEEAQRLSSDRVYFSENIYIQRCKELVELLISESEFYATPTTSIEETRIRLGYLKHVIENQNGYRIFYQNGEPIQRESDLHILFRLAWFASPFDVNSEVDNGRGPVDYKISMGSKDSTVVEFKLASNKHIQKHLINQVNVYKAANRTENAVIGILYFTESERLKMDSFLRDCDLTDSPNVFLIDARNDNKISASRA